MASVVAFPNLQIRLLRAYKHTYTRFYLCTYRFFINITVAHRSALPTAFHARENPRHLCLFVASPASMNLKTLPVYAEIRLTVATFASLTNHCIFKYAISSPVVPKGRKDDPTCSPSSCIDVVRSYEATRAAR